MGHGPVKLLGSVIKRLKPGDVVYPLNSQDRLIIVFITENAVITNTAELFLSHRAIRECGEWEREFPINWNAFENSEVFKLDSSPFERKDFEDGLVVVVLSADKTRAKVAILIGEDEESGAWLTDDLDSIPFSACDLVIPTGIRYELEENEDESEPQDDLGGTK